MAASSFPVRSAAFFGLLVLLLLGANGSASLAASRADEPQPRPSPTPQAHIVLTPVDGVALQDLFIHVSGVCWPASGVILALSWDSADGGHVLGGPIGITPEGTFEAEVVVPAPWATPGVHHVLATDDAGHVASASFVVGKPAPTETWTPSPTPSASLTPTPTTPTPTRTPSRTPSPTTTSTSTPTPTPSPTLRPVTPVVSGTPAVPGATPRPPATRVPAPLLPTSTHTPTATATETRQPRATATASATPTATPTSTSTATPTETPSPSPSPVTGVTPLPTPDVDDRLAVVRATEQVSPPSVLGITQTGRSWESGFFIGFVAAVILVALLIVLMTLTTFALLIAWRIVRLRHAMQLRQ